MFSIGATATFGPRRESTGRVPGRTSFPPRSPMRTGGRNEDQGRNNRRPLRREGSVILPRPNKCSSPGKVRSLLDRRRIGPVRIVHFGAVLPIEPNTAGAVSTHTPQEMHVPY